MQPLKPIILDIDGKEKEYRSDIEIGAHCPKHGAGANVINKVTYRDGTIDIFCWCGNQLAYIRNRHLYIREEVA